MMLGCSRSPRVSRSRKLWLTLNLCIHAHAVQPATKLSDILNVECVSFYTDLGEEHFHDVHLPNEGSADDAVGHLQVHSTTINLCGRARVVALPARNLNLLRRVQ